MRGLVGLALAVLVPLASAEATVLPPPLPADQTIQQLVSFAPRPQSVKCGDREARLVDGATIAPKSWQQWRPPVSPVGGTPPAPPPAVEVYTFSIDADGAVTDLKRQAGYARWQTDDQASVIATWRFAAGAPAKGCRVDLAPEIALLSEASPAKVIAALVAEGRAAPPALRKAGHFDGDCGKLPARRPHVLVYPDLRAFDDKALDPAWAFVRYDIDASGATSKVTIVAQGGEPAFADTAAAAIADSRYQPGGARTACYVTFKARPRATEAPRRPAKGAFDRPTDVCDVKALGVPETKPFPPGFAARRVAGWAYVRFDVAPWGQIGNIEVIAAQPAESFGSFARTLVSSAKVTPPPTGFRGCVVPVIYAIPAIPEDDF